MGKRLTIGGRLMLAFGAMCLIIIALVGFGVGAHRVADDTIVTLKRQSGNAMQAERVVRLFAQARVLAANALADDGEAVWRQAFTALVTSREQQARLVGSIVNPERRAKAETMAGLTERAQGVLTQIHDLRQAGRAAEVAPLLTAYNDLSARIDAEAEQLIVMIRDSSAKATAASDDKMAAVSQWALVVAALGLVLGGGLTVMISRGIAGPLARMSAAMTAVAQGDTAVPVSDQDRGDAIGQMARAVEVFRVNAQDNQRMRAEEERQRLAAEAGKRAALCAMAETVETEADAAVDDIAKLTADMGGTVERLHAMALRTSQGAGASASTADQVMSAAEAVAAATRQLHGSIAEIGRQLSNTRSVAREAVGAAKVAQDVMSGLSEATHRIGSVVSMIATVAGKTNLLALNATIEAARAGDAGKGFVVVANEVKGLATQTEQATHEITSQIGSILEVANRAADAMAAISTTISEIEIGASAIATAVDEQSAATSEIARAVEHTSDASRHMSSLMASMAADAQQSTEMSAEAQKDGARVTETVAGFSRTLGRLIRTSTPEVDRRGDPRFGVFVPCRATINGTSRDAVITNLSRGGVCLMVDGVAAGQAITVEGQGLGGGTAGRVVFADKSVAHVAFDPDSRLSDAAVERISHDGSLALLDKAKSDHQAFVAGVMAVLQGQSGNKAADLANHHTCRLGKWYDSVSDQRILDCPAFAAMVEPHQRVHDAGKRILAAYWQGDAAAAQAMAADLEKASSDVIALLGQLADEVRGTAASAAAA
jgi:methyl-accepting chemotaxis protein